QQRNSQRQREIEESHDVLPAVAIRKITDDHASSEAGDEQAARYTGSAAQRISLAHKKKNEVLCHRADGPDGECAACHNQPEVAAAQGARDAYRLSCARSRLSGSISGRHPVGMKRSEEHTSELQ